jgi:UDP-N-acetylglucosamine--N-acetylmuramyl-(pentapeptide) pyrophosphoryl-undecaprenol N-acetylglucosamine transferase
VTGIPALLVPLAGAAGDHQTANARAAARAGWAWCAEEGAWSDDSLADLVARVVGDRRTWLDASERARRFAPADAAERLVADCERQMAGRW